MKFGKKFLLAAILMMMVGFELSAIENMNTRPDEPMGYENYWSCISRKLGRGICNAAFGAIEIPLQMAKTSAEEGGFAGLTAGTLKGVGYCIGREIAGIVDILTFFMPLPGLPNDAEHGAGWGYGPFFTPEWILTPATDPYNVAYPQTGYLD